MCEFEIIYTKGKCREDIEKGLKNSEVDLKKALHLHCDYATMKPREYMPVFLDALLMCNYILSTVHLYHPVVKQN